MPYGGSAQKRLPGAWTGTGAPRRIFGWGTLPLRCLIGVGANRGNLFIRSSPFSRGSSESRGGRPVVRGGVRDRRTGRRTGRSSVRGSVRGSGELGTGSGYGFGVRVRVWGQKSSGAATANGSSTTSSLQTDGASPQAIYEPGANFIPLHRWPSSFDQKITTSNDGVT